MSVTIELINKEHPSHQAAFNELMQDKDIRQISTLRELYLGYFIKQSENIVGIIGLNKFKGEPAVNYGIKKEFRGQNIASVALEMLMDSILDENTRGLYGIVQWHYFNKEIIDQCQASRKILEKSGFIDKTDYDRQEANMQILYKHNPRYDKTLVARKEK